MREKEVQLITEQNMVTEADFKSGCCFFNFPIKEINREGSKSRMSGKKKKKENELEKSQQIEYKETKPT